MFRRFLRDDDGASAVEYGVLIALVVAAVIAVIVVLGGQVRQGFEGFSTELGNLGVNATPQ